MLLNDTAALRALLNMTLAPAAVLAITTGGGVATVKTTNAIKYLKDGLMSSKSALATQALAAPTTSTTKLPSGTAMTQAECDQWRFYTLPAGKTCYVVLALDSGANVVAFQSDYAGQDLTFRGGGVCKGTGNVPAVLDGFTPFGIIKVVSTTGTFLPGTTNLDAANLTFTFSDIALLPTVNP